MNNIINYISDKMKQSQDNWIKKFTYDDVSPNEQEYYISVLAGVFGERQRGIFRTIFHRINIAWKMLLGKEYLLSEIVLTSDEFQELKKKLGDL